MIKTHLLPWLLGALLFMAACKPSEKTVKTGDSRPGLEFQSKFFEAQVYKSKGNEKAALKAFQECLVLEPNNGACHYEAARIEHVINNNILLAEDHAMRAVASDPSNVWYHQLLGNIYRDGGKYDLAIKSFREVLRLNPNDPSALYEIANAHLYNKKYSEAIKALDELEAREGVAEELSFQKHQLYMQLNKPQDAAGELEKLAEAFPEEARYWGILAQFYQQNNDTEKAEVALQEMLQADPDNGQVHYQLSEYYATKGDDERSFEEMRKAFGTPDLDIDQKINVLLKFYQLTLANPAYNAKSYELLELARLGHPGEAKIYSMYGDFLYKDRDDNKALDMYRKAAALDGSKSAIWSQILQIETSLRRFDDLYVDGANAVELFPGQPQFYYYLGIACEQLKKYDEAIEALNTGKELVVENTPFLLQFYSSLGSSYHYTGNFTKSEESFEYALKLAPTNDLLLNNYAYYLSLRKARLEKAAEMSALSNTIQPNNPVYEDTYAWVMFQKGNFPDALTWIEKARASGAGGGEFLEHYGDILYRNGKINEALQAWKQAHAAGGASDGLDQKIQLQRLP
jgi:tetratricopeptide (TPR) repeat protein